MFIFTSAYLLFFSRRDSPSKFEGHLMGCLFLDLILSIVFILVCTKI